MLRLLYHYGADPFILNSYEQSLLHVACLSNRSNIVQELCNIIGTPLLEIKDNHARTALSVTSHPDIIDKLIESGADMSSVDHNNMNALMIAVSMGRIDVVHHLLSLVNYQLHQPNQLNRTSNQTTT